jgi:hypothetical protein
MSAAAHLLQYNVNLQQARDFVYANLNSPATIFDVAKQYGVTNAMLAEIYGQGVSADDVRWFFSSKGFVPSQLDVTVTPLPGGPGYDDAWLPEVLQPLAENLLRFNAESGALSTEIIRQGVIQVTGAAAYNEAFSLWQFGDDADSVLTPTELGFSHLGSIDSPAELESLVYGTVINLLRSVDVTEAQELAQFAEANAAALEAGDTGTLQSLLNLVVGVLQDAAPLGQQLVPEVQIAQVVTLVGQTYVTVVNGDGDLLSALLSGVGMGS